MTPPFPESLKYMEPFIGFLKALPDDAVNEDVDPQILEDALRSRFTTGNPHETLEADTRLLEDWLASFNSSGHVAHWIVGYLSCVEPEDIDPSIPAAPIKPLDPEVEQMVKSIESMANRAIVAAVTAPEPPIVQIDVPNGWTAQFTPGMSELKHGQSWARVNAINLPFFKMMHQQHSATSECTLPVTFGTNSGFKFQYSGNVTDYLLEVEGGYVRIRLSLGDTLDNEHLIEECFESLKVSQKTA